MIFFNDEQADDSSIYAQCSFNDCDMRYHVEVNVCPSPRCNCGRLDLIFNCEPNETVATNETPTEQFTIIVDCIEEQMEYKQIDKSLREFAKYLKKAMDKTDWHLLYSIFLTKKTALTEVCLNNGFDIDFSECDYTYSAINTGEMVFIHMLFPFVRTIYLDVNGKSFFCFASYCLASGCHCSNVAIQVFPKTSKNRKIYPIGSFDVDYKNKKLTGASNITIDSEQVDLLEIEKLFVEQNVAIYDYLKKTHSQLKKIYQQALKKYHDNTIDYEEGGIVQTFSRSTVKIGRNDPCPCGSGKKYKKCCG